MTISELIKDCKNKLEQNNIEEATLKIKMIITSVLNVNKEYLITHDNKKIDKKSISIIKNNINKLIKGIPVQYITKKQEFMGLDFYVDKNVLIPQPDTEILVEEVINIVKSTKKDIDEIKILDLCTGSGAIGVSLKKYVPQAKIIATDISKKTLKVAKINEKKNNVEIEFKRTDMFKRINKKFNIIVSNPPYIKTKEIKTLDKEVQKEPAIALNGGQDGLKFYRIIIENAYKYLEENGYLCLEIGYNQKQEVLNLIKENGNYKNIYSKKDLAGNDRIIICNRIG